MKEDYINISSCLHRAGEVTEGEKHTDWSGKKWRNTSIRPQVSAEPQLFKGLYLISQAYIVTSLFKIPGWKIPFSCERRASAGTSGVFKHARCNYLRFRESTNCVQAIMPSQCSGTELATIRHVIGAERAPNGSFKPL